MTAVLLSAGEMSAMKRRSMPSGHVTAAFAVAVSDCASSGLADHFLTARQFCAMPEDGRLPG